jgi:hypothetical protein
LFRSLLHVLKHPKRTILSTVELIRPGKYQVTDQSFVG